MLSDRTREDLSEEVLFKMMTARVCLGSQHEQPGRKARVHGLAYAGLDQCQQLWMNWLDRIVPVSRAGDMERTATERIKEEN
jgi:hypothetical protein